MRTHTSLLLGEFINGVAGILGSATPRTIATFDVLDGIGTGSKALFVADGTRHIARAVDLHVHSQLILITKGAVAFVALIGWSYVLVGVIVGSIHTIQASSIISLAPLVVAEQVTAAPITTFRTISHHSFLLRCRYSWCQLVAIDCLHF